MSLQELQSRSKAIRREASAKAYRAGKAMDIRREVQGETREEIMAALRGAYWVVEGELEGRGEGEGR